MPVKSRRRKAVDDYPAPWEDRPISLERWKRNRARIMANTHPGKRPEEWWEYESPKPRSPDFDLPESVQLYAMSELTEDELAELMPEWRRRYEQAQGPSFSYCNGHDPVRNCATWIEGAAARKAFYKWAGIPPAIVKQWDAERARRARTIKGLVKA